ncbi:MAG: hypothetical protein O3C57_00880 [Verrucomicrobia bacterium]|nr:hypothetical protein [Verrucomicrobiota bacterium]
MTLSVHKSWVGLFAATLFAVLAASGCSKKDAPEAAAPEPAPTQAATAPKAFSITATDVVVEEEELPEVSMQKRVLADFNQDDLDDIALVEQNGTGKSTVSIYLQKRDDSLTRKYYKAGGISMNGEFNVTALMSKSGKDFTDLIVIQQYSPENKEMVHFRTRGTDFKEVERVAIK